VPHREHRRADDVGDVRPAARLAAVAVEVEPRARRECVHDPGEGHVRSLARAEGVEVAERHTVEPELARVGCGELLAGELRDPVRRERMGLGVLGGRVPLCRPVHRGGRREDDADAVARRRLEHALRSQYVAPQVEREYIAEAAHAGLAREVEDAVEAGEVEIVLCKVDAAHVEPAGVLLLERRIVVVGEAVEADGLVPGGNERLREVRSDEAGCARDGIPHDSRVPAPLAGPFLDPPD
jgi:hypothetical protein